jgi:hypothetical protein
MDFGTEHRFEAPLDRVVAMLADADFERERGLSVGATECEASVHEEEDGGFSVAIRRTMPTEGIQPEFRPFIGSSITVRYSEVWEPPDGESRHGTFAIEIVGVPVRAAGTVSLSPDGDATAYDVQGTVTAQMHFLGSLVTQAVVSALDAGVDRECEAAESWLARG